MTQEEFLDFLARYGEQTAADAQAAFDEFMDRVAAGDAPQDAIRTVLSGWQGQTVETLSAAFSELLAKSIGGAQVRDLPVGGVTLSEHLYSHILTVQAEVREAVKIHAQGVLQARELARRLYDGYNPTDGIRRPLEGRARGELPKYLRALTEDQPTREALGEILQTMQTQAARVKSDALRTAYMEAIDTWADGEAQVALRNRLWVAVREKNRYFADRIAQTELARAHQAQVGREIMGDDSITVVQVMLNPRHPVADVCDLHGRADLWGLGKGCYPKAKAPRPPFHPWCACYLRTRPSLSAVGARLKPAGEAAYLRGLGVASAARVAGSRDRLQAILNGADPLRTIEAGTPDVYRTKRLGDPAALEHPLMGDE